MAPLRRPADSAHFRSHALNLFQTLFKHAAIVSNIFHIVLHPALLQAFFKHALFHTFFIQFYDTVWNITWYYAMICEIIQIVFKHALCILHFSNMFEIQIQCISRVSITFLILFKYYVKSFPSARPVFKYFSHTELLCHTHFKYFFHKFQTSSL